VACKKLLITSRAPVPVPLLSNTVLTFQKSHIPPHTSAHKHAQGKIFQYCVMKGNTLNHMTSRMATKNSVHLIAHTKWEYEHRKALPNWNHSSVTNNQLYEHSQPMITPRSRVHPGKLTSYLQIHPVHVSQLHFFKTHFNTIIPFITRSFKWFFPSGLSTKSCMHLSFLPCVPYAQPISIFIWLLKYEDWFNSGSDFFCEWKIGLNGQLVLSPSN